MTARRNPTSAAARAAGVVTTGIAGLAFRGQPGAGAPLGRTGRGAAWSGMATGIGGLLERLPTLRLDPDAEPPSIIGMYERGATEINVLF